MYPIKNCKYPIDQTFKGKYPTPQKGYLFLWGYQKSHCWTTICFLDHVRYC